MKSKFMKKDFQKMNNGLTLVTSVKNFRKIRHNLYNWGLILELTNKLFILFSIFFLLVSILEVMTNAPPFLVGISAIYLDTKYIQPD